MENRQGEEDKRRPHGTGGQSDSVVASGHNFGLRLQLILRTTYIQLTYKLHTVTYILLTDYILITYEHTNDI